MADLFKIGYGGGAPKAIDYSKALDPLANKIGARLKESKAKTDALMMNMPQGVPIDKVPEQLRGQVTDFLTQNKQAYVDASKVIASGIPSTDQRYIDAISTINQVDAKFKNLSNTLEDIALKRQASLDSRDHSDGSLDWEISDHEDLANGNMYDNMTIQDDGGFNYNSNDGVTKRWKDYSNTFQTSNAGQEGFFNLEEMALKDGDNGRGFNRNRFENRFDSLTKGLKGKGARDFVFADNDFIAQKTGTEVGTEEFEKAKKQLVNKGDFDKLVVEYKKYGVDELEKIHGLAKSKYDEILAAKNSGPKGRTFSWGYRDNEQLSGTLNGLKDLITKESGEIRLPNSSLITWDGKNKVFRQGEEGKVVPVEKIVQVFEGLYTQSDLFGDFEFGQVNSSDDQNKDNNKKSKMPSRASAAGTFLLNTMKGKTSQSAFEETMTSTSKKVAENLKENK